MTAPINMQFSITEIWYLYDAIDFYRSMNEQAADDITGVLQGLQDKLEDAEKRAGVKDLHIGTRRLRFRRG